MPVDETTSWMDLIIFFLQDGHLPHDKKETAKLKSKAARFTMVQGKLYKRGFSFSLMKCVTDLGAYYILREIHEGICRNHIGARTLANKALRQGYFWPTMAKDTKNMVKKCQTCRSTKTCLILPPNSSLRLLALDHSSNGGWTFWGPYQLALGSASLS